MNILEDSDLSNTSLKDKVYQLLRRAIVERQIEPGVELNESELAARFNISRSPIREAVHLLHSNGLVFQKPNGRYQTQDLSEEALRHLYAVRVALEGMAAMEACRHLTPEELVSFEGLIESEREAARRNDHDALLKLGSDIHYFLAAASRNPELESLVVLTMDRVKPFTVRSTSLPERRSVVLEEHAEILKCLRMSDPLRARTVMEEHIANSRDRLLRG